VWNLTLGNRSALTLEVEATVLFTFYLSTEVPKDGPQCKLHWKNDPGVSEGQKAPKHQKKKIEVKRNGNYKHKRKIKINFDLIMMGNEIT
jgi:hypothetical protein